jgi:CubicO group peptidase (beta-lactamase class C family)
MTETSYFLKDLDQSHIAQPYSGTTLKAEGFYGYPDYPSGQIRTSARHLARFLEMISSGGTLGGIKFLESKTVTDMLTPQVATSIAQGQGIVFFSETKGGKSVFGHDGSDKGVTTQMFFDPKTKAGYVILMNARDQLDDIEVADNAINAMTDKLMELARTLP